MRRSTSALSAAVLGTALSAATLVAQQPPPDSGSGTSTTPAINSRMLATRGARQFVRSGWDYLKYKEYDRALAAFRRAEARKSELNDAERRVLAQGLDQAKRGLKASRPTSRSVRMQSDDTLPATPPPIRLAGASSDEGSAPALAVSVPEIPAEQPPAAPEVPSATSAPVNPALLAPAPLASNEPAPIPEPPPLPATLEETGAAAPAPTAAPAAPAAEESVALPPLSNEGSAAEAAKPTMTAEPAPASAEAPVASPVPATPPAAAAPETLPPLPEVPEPPQSSPAHPESEPAPPAEEVAAPVPAQSQPVSSELGVPDAVPPGTSERLAAPPVQEVPAAPADPLATAVPSNPAMAPAAEPQPRPRRSIDSFLPQRSSEPYRSTLTPELQREVEKMAQRMDEDLQRDRDPNNLPPDAPPPGTANPAIGSNPSTRLEITRAPSPTEARPIRAIPVPDEFTPLPPRQWSPNRKYWSASAVCHLPLYFQDASLERYGHSVEQFFGPAGRYLSYPVDDPKKSIQRNQLIQPFFSMGLFAAQVAALPYNLVVDPPWEAEYDLGYYRPADRVPTDMYYLPLHGVGPPLKGKDY